jgi:glycine C-acetyltransferase/8-amino-7-oxononanoate synthase
MNLNLWLEAELAELKSSGLFRSLKELQTVSTSKTEINGQRVILLASNNYLGLSCHPKVIQAAVEATLKYGTGAGGSRLTSGNLALYKELEEKLANLKGVEASVVFSSGYLANLGAISSIVGEGDEIFSDELNHASLIDGCRLSRAEKKIYKHADVRHLKALIANSTAKKKLIVTDGLFSMDGDLAPLPQIVEIAQEYEAMLMVDDAHSIGVLGKRGGGSVEHFNLGSKVDIQMGTLSKTLGGVGGYVAGSRSLIEYLKNRARSFIFSTALPPSAIASSSAALDVIREEPGLRIKLQQNAQFLRERLKKLGFKLLPSETQILPLLIGEAQKAVQFSNRLLELGVYAPAIRPPAVPPQTSRIRISVIASHSFDELEEAAEAFATVGRELGIIP